jgi:tRNA G18 (ribose-2'-O)-methylase SpoU
MSDCVNFPIQDKFKPLTIDQVKEEQKARQLPFAVAAFNLDGSLNVGALIRTSVAFGAKKFIMFGLKKYDSRSTVGAHNYIEVERVPINVDAGDFGLVYQKLGCYNVSCVETGGQDLDDHNFKDDVTEDKIPCILLGEEQRGIPEEILSKYRRISIPMQGILRSMNVSAAGAIAMNKIREDLAYLNEHR